LRQPDRKSARDCRFFYYWWTDLYNDTTPGAEQVFVNGYSNTLPSQPQIANWSLTTRGGETRGADRRPPPPTLVDPLWKPVSNEDPDALGMYKPYFFSQNLRPTHSDIDCSEHP
jgi:hypothetical protein